MSGTATARIEGLTTELGVLMVGSRQVTMSVYNQLDWVDAAEVEPFSRVAPRDASRYRVYVVGVSTGKGRPGFAGAGQSRYSACLRRRGSRLRSIGECGAHFPLRASDLRRRGEVGPSRPSPTRTGQGKVDRLVLASRLGLGRWLARC